MYVVFNADTTREYAYRLRYHDAIRLRDKLLKAEGRHGGRTIDYQVYHRDFYEKYIVYDRTVVNLMTGKPVVEPSNKPYSCSVASETYWTS